MDTHDAKTISDLAMSSSGPVKVAVRVPDSDQGNIDITLVHKDMKVIDVEKHRARPSAIKRDVTLRTIDSFMAYVNEFETTAKIFGSYRSDGVIFKCILDYHSNAIPSFCHHTVSMDVRNSLPWIKWMDNSLVKMTQRKFSEFIEDNAEDIIEPATGSLLSQIKSVRLKRGSTVDSNVTDDGDNVSASAHNVLASGVPQAMTLALKPWAGMEGHMGIKARVYAHLDDDSVRFSYRLINSYRAIEVKFEEYVALIKDELSIDVLI